MGIPQICFIVLIALGLGISLAKHGEPRNDTYNFFSTLIGSLIYVGLLILGGFFK